MILRIEAGLLSKEILREKHFQKMADSIGDKQSKKNLSTGTVRSIFGQERNKKELIQFNYNSINKIIHHLYIKKRITGAKTWETFKDAYIFDRYDSFFNEFVPIAHFQQLSDQLKQDLSDAVKRTLLRIYPTSELKELDVWSLNNVPKVNETEKFKQYLDTSWYAYFYFAHNGNSQSGIIRTVIHILQTGEAITEVVKGDNRFNDFKGSVRFDKREEVLLFDMTTKEFGERAVHIKVWIGSSEDIPEMAIGEYSNIGIGGKGIHSSRMVFVHLKDSGLGESKIFTPDDDEYEQLPLSLKKYLSREKDNWRHTPPDPILSFHALLTYTEEQEVQLYKDRRGRNKRVRITSKYQVVISSPRYLIDKDEFEEFRESILKIKNFLENGLPYKVIHDYYLKNPRPKFLSTRDHDFYSKRIMECDLLLVFLHHASAEECLAEIAMAIEMGKVVYILIPQGGDIPLLLQKQRPEGLTIDNYAPVKAEELLEYFQACVPYGAEDDYFHLAHYG